MAQPGKEDVLKAIAVMDKDFLAPESGQAAQTVMRFAESSKEVAIQLNPKPRRGCSARRRAPTLGKTPA